jgi:hypothetical protein
LPGRIVKALGHPVAVGFVGTLLADLGQVIRAIGMLHMGQEFRAFVHQVGTAPEQVAGCPPVGRIDTGMGKPAPAPQRRNLLRIDLVMLGLAPVDGVHQEGVSEDKGDALFGTQVGEPITGEDAFNGNHQSIPIGGNGLEERFGSGFHIAV